MAKELSRTQSVFLVKLLKNKSVPRTSLNPTGNSLAKLGLVRYVSMFGWSLTPSGIAAATAHEGILDELSTDWR